MASQRRSRAKSGQNPPQAQDADGAPVEGFILPTDRRMPEKLRRWLHDAAEGATLELSAGDARELLAVVDRRERVLTEYRERLEAAFQAHAEGGPASLAEALGLAPYDRRAKMTAEEAANVLLAYKNAVRNLGSARAAAERVCAEHEVWPSLGAFREWLKRQLAELRDPESPLRGTFGGALLDPDALPLPDLR